MVVTDPLISPFFLGGRVGVGGWAKEIPIEFLSWSRSYQKKSRQRIALAESLYRLPHLVSLKLSDCSFQGALFLGLWMTSVFVPDVYVCV